MPRYNFEVRTDTHVMLTQGGEYKDDSAARTQAACKVGDLLKDHATRLWHDEDWQMDVTNEAGLILYVIHVSARKTAATSG